MDKALLSDALESIGQVLADLLDANGGASALRVPLTLRDQLQWVRTLQQVGRDAEVLAEAAVILLRRLDETGPRFGVARRGDD